MHAASQKGHNPQIPFTAKSPKGETVHKVAIKLYIAMHAQLTYRPYSYIGVTQIKIMLTLLGMDK